MGNEFDSNADMELALHEQGTPIDTDETDWDPTLLEHLHTLLNSAELGSQALEISLRKLHLRYGDAVYTELIYVLSHLRFPRAEAKRHWEQVVAHRQMMQERLGTVDMRVALVSYFVDVQRKLKNPMVIEMRLFEKTRASAYRDELTGLHNFRLFREYIVQEISRSQRCREPLSLVMLDVDHFKHYNDANGHEAGNEVLAMIARLLVSNLRAADIAARYGGEEFALILPSTTKSTGSLLAERLRAAIERHCFQHEDKLPGGRLTASLGVATYPADAQDATSLVRSADRAMYVSKSGGRNQVSLYGQSRRSYGRVDTALRGSCRTLCDDVHPLTTINMSEAGLLFRTEQRLPVGALLEIRIDAPSGEVRAAGSVVHAEPAPEGGQRIAARILHVEAAERTLLLEHLREVEALREREHPETVCG
jgi:diguanylate cyclase (GGDEF)-like protein